MALNETQKDNGIEKTLEVNSGFQEDQAEITMWYVVHRSVHTVFQQATILSCS